MDALRTYRQPAFIYLPPGAELRGGAWVVIDGQINAQQVRYIVTRRCLVTLRLAEAGLLRYHAQNCRHHLA